MDSAAFPSSFLPPLTRVEQCSPSQISLALGKIAHIYFPINSLVISPETHRARKYKPIVPDSGYASADEDEDEDLALKMMLPLEPQRHRLKQDPLERQFTIKWLTGFIARSDLWMVQYQVSHSELNDMVETAATLLSSFAGSANETAEAVVRSFSFPSSGQNTVTAYLNDAPLSAVDHTSVGLQSWGSSILLAARMSESPAQFFPPGTSALRIVELGAGTGLLSIVASQLCLGATIVATDYHPDVLCNLSKNVQDNATRALSSIGVHKFDWEEPHYSTPFNLTFDVVLAADVIYHDAHARWLKGCVQRLLTQPAGDHPGGIFWMVIPIRSTGRHERMHLKVNDVFTRRPEDNDGLDLDLVILVEYDLVRHSNFGRADEDGYKLYKIGWSEVKP